jgi:segregation and condensation protein A
VSYKVHIESFEGPFDLLLYLVSRQKVDIGAISITEIADQYLAEVASMNNLDLDVASDFLLVAATLLEIKAASLIPKEKSEIVEEFQDISPHEARDILVTRLLEYKKYKNASAAMLTRYEAEARMHARPFGPERQHFTRMPDYLDGVTLDALALLCAQAYARRDVALLEAEHIASKPIPIETHVRAIHRRISNAKHLMFSDLVSESTPSAVIVVTFLAVLELYKRSMIKIEQKKSFGDISINFIEESGELSFEGDEAISAVFEQQENE